MSRMSQSEVRQMFVQNNKGVRLKGYDGYWYRCAICGKWCGRPGEEGAKIPDYCKMEVDHRIPWSKGGLDAMYNLQPLCKPCNRAKSNNQSSFETANTLVRAAASGNLHNQLGNMAISGLKRKLGIKDIRR